MAKRRTTKSTNGETRRRYDRINSGRNIAQDPATGQDAPPNFGRQIMPHVATFSSIVTTASRAYKNPDEAVLHSLENARWMRNTCLIMECLEARQRGTALLNWHLEAEDKDDPKQKKICDDLTTIIKELPDFTEYRRNLLEALWYGRYMVKHAYGYSYRTGKKRIVVKSWQPVHGDKLVFRYDDGSGKWDPNQLGIRVIGTNITKNDVMAGDRRLEPTYEGLAYFLEPWERSLVAVHKHIIEDAPYEYALQAGSIHGVGIRSRIYWTWFQMQEVLRMLMDFLQRSAMGIWVYFYPAGNEEAKLKMEDVAKKQTDSNILVMPRSPGDPAMDAYGVDRVEVSPGGGEALKSILHDYFGHQIKRYILGQILSTESDATGLGSGVADLHLESFMQIIRYDATKLEETITRELVEPLKNFNWPDAVKYLIRFKIDTEAADTKDKLAAVESAWNMGARIKEADVMDLIGFSLPTANDKALVNPAVASGGEPGQGASQPGEQTGPPQSEQPGQEAPDKPKEKLPPGAEPAKPEPPKVKNELDNPDVFKGLTPEQALSFMHLLKRKAILEPSDEAHYVLHLLGATMDDDRSFSVPVDWALALSHLMKRPDEDMEFWEFDPLEAESRLALAHLSKYQRDDDLRKAIALAAKNTDREPSDAQREAGNYSKGKFSWQGWTIAIENPKGSMRRGIDQEGNEWSVKMPHHYGYFKLTESEADGDHVDVFVGPDPESEIVFVADQLGPEGEWDEHKCFIGFHSQAAAKQAFLDAYSGDEDRLGALTPMTLPQFETWLTEGDTSAPISESAYA